MTAKFILTVIFLLFAVYGAFGVTKRARDMRAVRKYKDFIFAWSEYPVSALRYDTISWIATSIHWFTTVMIGLFELLTLVVLPLPIVASSFFVFPIMIGVVSGVGYMWGTIIFHPVALFLAGNRHYAIANEGIMFAGNIIPWSAFTHFSFDREKKIIRLWSSSFRGAIALMFAPSEEHFPKVIDILQSHLPNEDIVSVLSLMRQWKLPLVMVVICCMPILVTIFLTIKLPADIVLIVNGLLMFVLMTVGGPVLLRSVLGKTIQPAVIE